MLVVDVLHQWESGVWKHIFTHLLCILHSYRSNKVILLNKRLVIDVVYFLRTWNAYFPQSLVCSFFWDHNSSLYKKYIRHETADGIQFWRSTSSELLLYMSSLALKLSLKISLPVFEGLLPSPHDKIVQNLIYLVSTVHMLAKLHLHTDATVSSLHEFTKQFGEALRKFKNVTCAAHETKELPNNYEKWLCREGRLYAQGQTPKLPSRTAMEHVFNINTYKIHVLANYAHHIMKYGMTDQYSTSIVSLSASWGPHYLMHFRARPLINAKRTIISIRTR